MFTYLTLFLQHFDEFWYFSLLVTALVWKTCVWCCVVSLLEQAVSTGGKVFFFPLDEKPVRINRTVNKSVLWTDYSLIRDLWSSVSNLQPLNLQGVFVLSKCEVHCETWLWPPNCQWLPSNVSSWPRSTENFSQVALAFRFRESSHICPLCQGPGL